MERVAAAHNDMKNTEVPAKGIRGFFLYSPVTKEHFFRVYDLLDKSKFTDFKVTAEEIEVELISDFNSFYIDPENPEKNKLDFSSRVLGK